MSENNTNPVPSVVIGHVSEDGTTEFLTPEENTNQTTNNEQTNGPESSTPATTTEASTDTTTTTPAESNSSVVTNASTDTTQTNSSVTTSNTPSSTSNTSVISNTATSSSSSTNKQPEMKISENGTMSIDGKVATNEDLQKYFDYTKYKDKEAARMVEGIFKSDTVTINGITYKAELNANGEMVSVDGTKRLTQEEIRSYFGDKGYEALVCKTTKDVTIDEDGKIKIADREKPFKIHIEQLSDTTSNNMTNTADSRTNTATNGSNVQARISDPRSGGSSGGGGGGGYSGGGGGSYSGGGGTNSGTDTTGTTGKPDAEEVEEAGTPVIMVDFGTLGSIRDSLQTLKGQLSGVCDDYGGTINGLSGNGSAWSGVDKDAYISQKKGYVSNIGEVSSTLDSFVSYLDTCIDNYEQLESNLAAKQIS